MRTWARRIIGTAAAISEKEACRSEDHDINNTAQFNLTDSSQIRVSDGTVQDQVKQTAERSCERRERKQHCKSLRAHA
jgi:hypothetical protein